MKKSHFSEEQIIGILRKQEAGRKTVDICRWHGISEAMFTPENEIWIPPITLWDAVTGAKLGLGFTANS